MTRYNLFKSSIAINFITFLLCTITGCKYEDTIQNLKIVTPAGNRGISGNGAPTRALPVTTTTFTANSNSLSHPTPVPTPTPAPGTAGRAILAGPTPPPAQLRPTPTPSPNPIVSGIQNPLLQVINDGSKIITSTQLHNVYLAINTNFISETDLYNNAVGNASYGGFSSPTEWAAFMGNILHESGKFEFTKEIACQSSRSACSGHYGPDGPNGQVYYGRGYMQLSWGTNYKSVSQAIFGNDELYNNPDEVSDNLSTNWKATMGFWRISVHSDFNPQDFASSVLKVNGDFECHGGHTDATQTRYDYFKKIMAIVAPGAAVNCSCPGIH